MFTDEKEANLECAYPTWTQFQQQLRCGRALLCTADTTLRDIAKYPSYKVDMRDLRAFTGLKLPFYESNLDAGNVEGMACRILRS